MSTITADSALNAGATPPATTVAAPQARRFKRPTVGVIFASAFLLTIVFLAVFADYLPFIRYANTKVQVDGRARPYGLGPGTEAWFGLDRLANDVFAKCIYGARTTLQVGIYATAFGLVVGGILGVIAGYFRGWADRVVSIIVDCLLALPPLLLAIILVNRLDDVRQGNTYIGWMSRKWQIVITLGVLAVAPLARIVRAQTLTLREREFVLAARSVGAKSSRVIFREILPNLVPAMLTVAFTGLGILIAAEGALAFLGLGVEIGTPTWGKLIQENRDKIDDAWWATLFPCGMLFLTVLSFNLLGDALSRRFDIRQAGV